MVKLQAAKVLMEHTHWDSGLVGVNAILIRRSECFCWNCTQPDQSPSPVLLRVPSSNPSAHGMNTFGRPGREGRGSFLLALSSLCLREQPSCIGLLPSLTSDPGGGLCSISWSCMLLSWVTRRPAEPQLSQGHSLHLKAWPFGVDKQATLDVDRLLRPAPQSAPMDAHGRSVTT